jgi:Cytidylate kinase-like family
MATPVSTIKYVPGTYVKKRPDAATMAGQYVQQWELRQRKLREHDKPTRPLPPCICFSRKIGAGALEVADILAEKYGYRVYDRQILEHIVSETSLRDKTVAFFDECYPGKMTELGALLFGEKSFVIGDYVRHLASVVYSLAETGPCIFVGRGTHLVLPRDRVLAVRVISSPANRLARLAKIMGVKEHEAAGKMDPIDKEQRDFFKRAFGKKEASPYEFDLVINCDFISDPRWAAAIVVKAFGKKFGKLIKAEK